MLATPPPLPLKLELNPHDGSAVEGGVLRARHDETQRLKAVQRYDILDTPPDGTFDRITALAAHLFQVPIAIVSIVDRDRIWFKSAHGIGVTQVGRDDGLCTSAILKDTPHVVHDARLDPAALSNPLVAGEMGLRFYAGAPLATLDGYNLGTLCVIDRQPREFSTQQAQLLKDLAALVMDQMELRLAARLAMTKLVRAKSAAEKSNRAKTDFITSMSHDLRSPLNAILGFAQLLESDTTPQTEAQKESVAQILRAGWSLLDLINSILDLALTESGELALAPEPVSLATVLDESQAEVSAQAQKYEITLSLSRSAEPLWVYADAARLKQVLTHLLSNAIKFNQSGGTVAVGCTEMAGAVRISVKDSGPGLTAEQVGQLFLPFNRLSKAARGEEGTGIGLALIKRLVELMGGTIGVDSTVGKGSVFWVEMPRASEPADAGEHSDLVPRAPAADLSTHDRIRDVLCIEDNPANLKQIELLLARRPNLRLLSAWDVTYGLQLARDHRPELILLDVNLPNAHAGAALARLAADPHTRAVPVIAISADGLPQPGFFDTLTKPIQVGEFMAALDRALSVTAAAKGASP